MVLIISEKPSTARTIAHSVGAREKVYGSKGKAFCYKSDEYYVVNARGHLYGLGEPEDYGYSKNYKIDELPMFPDFKIFPAGEDTEDLRNLIAELMGRDDVESLICATDAGREGELIFRQIYQANNCKKPVKRMWCNSMTDEAIRKCFENLPPDSDFDGEYLAAFTRQQADWIIGMNLSRLYGVLDNYPHHIGRVKTPVLSLIVERDNEIANFKKTVSYRLEMPDGAISDSVYSTQQEAESIAERLNGTEVTVISSAGEKKSKNRPLLHNLSTLQQEANRVYGYTAKQTLEAAQTLYEKSLITYPRTDCNYVSEDMTQIIKNAVNAAGLRAEYESRVDGLLSNGLNLDGRVISTEKMNGHDHHAIIPESGKASTNGLSDVQKNIYGLIVNRLLCAVDKPYTYKECNYEFSCGGVTFKLKSVIPIETGWKEYDTEKSADMQTKDYRQGEVFKAEGIKVKVCETQPLKHYTDASLISVMCNIDNRIDDRQLKTAVSGKGIGTEATRADIIEELIRAGYIERNGKNIIATPFGKDFIASIPDNVKSVERTAEWEQIFENIRKNGIGGDKLIEEVRNFVESVINLETNPEHKRDHLHYENPNAPKREVVGKCPRCGKNIYEGEKGFYCESGKNGCGFALWKQDKFLKDPVTKAKAVKLLNGEAVRMKAVSKVGETYEADYVIEDTGKYINLKRIAGEKKIVGVCPRCGKNIIEGRQSFYCESGKDGCRFTLWKEDRYNGITVSASNAEDFLKGKAVVKTKKKLNGENEKITYRMVDTGTYVNLKAEGGNRE